MTLAQLSAADWPAVSALLDEALALPQEQRDTFVQSLDGERAQYRETLRALLERAAGVETDEFLATLPRFTRVAAAPAGALTELSAGDSIGPYRLISELGAGGMGAVWLAERADGSLKRRVALKLPRLVWAKGLAERMARERDILASLEHPHIARLYDAGVDQHGRPYLALEYVEGQPIDVYAKERNLSVRQKLDLLVQVCSAVAFAHSRLVVHRDLKPSNILVTTDGQVRLLDFGIAKLMEGDRTQETQLTQLAGRALTLDYASPEQIKGEPIGTASDVYSLGVVAYELLTGAKPYRLKRGSAAELEEAIATADAPKASDAATEPQSKRALRGDLDAILNKALKKAAAERYATVDALVLDLARYLERKPVSARPDSVAYRLARLSSRHKAALVTGCTVAAAFVLAIGAGATALVILALVVGLAGALWQMRVARRKADEAAAAAARAQAIQSYLLSIFRTNSARQFDPARARETTARQLLDIGYSNLSKALQHHPAARADVTLLLCDMYSELGLSEQAAALAEQAVRLAEQAHGEDSPVLVRALCEFAYELNHIGGRTDERRQAADRALELVRRFHNQPSALRSRVYRTCAQSRQGADARQFIDLAIDDAVKVGDAENAYLAYQVAGQLLITASAYEEAATCFEQALIHHARLPDPFEYETIFMRAGLAACYAHRLRTREAEASMREAMRIAVETAGPTSLDALQTQWRLAQLLIIAGKAEQALAEVDQVLAQVDGPDSTDMFTRPNALLERGGALSELGRAGEAITVLERAVRLIDQARPHSPFACTARERLALALLKAAQLERAIEVIEACMALRRQLGSGPGEFDFDVVLWLRAVARAGLGSLDDARADLSRIRCLKSGSEATVLTVRASITELQIALAADDRSAAEDAAERVEALLAGQEARGPLYTVQAEALLALAAHYQRQGAEHRVASVMASCADLFDKHLPPGAPLRARFVALASQRSLSAPLAS